MADSATYNRLIPRMQRMNVPIRIRLSVSYFLIFTAAGVLLCCASYWMARRSLLIALHHELDERIDDVHDFLVGHKLAGDTARAIDEVAAEYQLKDDGKWLQVKDGSGQWIYRARRMMIAPHDVPLASTLPPDGFVQEFDAGPKRVRSLVRAFTIDGHTYVVEAGATLTKTEATLLTFRNGLFLISPIVFVIAGFAGHWLSRRALDPVTAIAREAQRIHEGNLQIRLPRLKTRDELAHLSATLNDMLERIESAVSSVRDFTSYASHELRTPVTLIRSEADLALNFERTQQEYREALGVIGSEAQRMSSLLDSLLFLARADGGAEQVRLEPVDARRVCRQVCDKWKPLLAKSRIQLRGELTDNPQMVMADAPYLLRMLTVILENAWKYTPAEGTVSLLLEPLGARVRFSVSDTGIGIPLKDQAHIFDRFRRASNVQQAEVQGSGLGLALAAWIAKRHGAAIEVESTPGAGSLFSFELPAARIAQNIDAVEIEPEAAHRG